MATGVVSNTDALLRGFAGAEAFASACAPSRARVARQHAPSRRETIERAIADLLPVCASVSGGSTRTTTREDDLPSSADPPFRRRFRHWHSGRRAPSARGDGGDEATESERGARASARASAPRRRRRGGGARGACRAGSAA